MSLSVMQLMQEIEKLEQNQRQELRSWLLISNSLGKADVTTDEQAAADVICKTLDKLSGGKLHILQLQRHNGWKAFAEKVPQVFDFIREGGCSDRLEMLMMLRIGVRYLYRDLTERGYTATAYTIMAQFHRVPAIINRQFPGFAACKLLGKIARHK
jgi:hypothetical protein